MCLFQCLLFKCFHSFLNYITPKIYSRTYYYYNRFTALCMGQPGWAGTRRNIHPLTPCHDHQSSIITFLHLLRSVAFSVFNLRAWQSFLHNLFPCPLWSASLSGILHFIVHTFLLPIIFSFSQHMPMPSQLFFAIVPRLCYLILVS